MRPIEPESIEMPPLRRIYELVWTIGTEPELSPAIDALDLSPGDRVRIWIIPDGEPAPPSPETRPEDDTYRTGEWQSFFEGLDELREKEEGPEGD